MPSPISRVIEWPSGQVDSLGRFVRLRDVRVVRPEHAECDDSVAACSKALATLQVNSAIAVPSCHRSCGRFLVPVAQVDAAAARLLWRQPGGSRYARLA
jgi:hypothetical protein